MPSGAFRVFFALLTTIVRPAARETAVACRACQGWRCHRDQGAFPFLARHLAAAAWAAWAIRIAAHALHAEGACALLAGRARHTVRPRRCAHSFFAEGSRSRGTVGVATAPFTFFRNAAVALAIRLDDAGAVRPARCTFAAAAIDVRLLAVLDLIETSQGHAGTLGVAVAGLTGRTDLHEHLDATNRFAGVRHAVGRNSAIEGDPARRRNRGWLCGIVDERTSPWERQQSQTHHTRDNPSTEFKPAHDRILQPQQLAGTAPAEGAEHGVVTCETQVVRTVYGFRGGGTRRMSEATSSSRVLAIITRSSRFVR